MSSLFRDPLAFLANLFEDHVYSFGYQNNIPILPEDRTIPLPPGVITEINFSLAASASIPTQTESPDSELGYMSLAKLNGVWRIPGNMQSISAGVSLLFRGDFASLTTSSVEEHIVNGGEITLDFKASSGPVGPYVGGLLTLGYNYEKSSIFGEGELSYGYHAMVDVWNSLPDNNLIALGVDRALLAVGISDLSGFISGHVLVNIRKEASGELILGIGIKLSIEGEAEYLGTERSKIEAAFEGFVGLKFAGDSVYARVEYSIYGSAALGTSGGLIGKFSFSGDYEVLLEVGSWPPQGMPMWMIGLPPVPIR